MAKSNCEANIVNSVDSNCELGGSLHLYIYHKFPYGFYSKI